MYKKNRERKRADAVAHGDVSKKRVISEIERIYVEAKIEAMVR